MHNIKPIYNGNDVLNSNREDIYRKLGVNEMMKKINRATRTVLE